MSEEIESCHCIEPHPEVLEKVRQNMVDEERLYDLAELFKAFGDSTRIRILWALDQGELCVCDIAALLKMSQSAISHQLRTLKQSRLVNFRREGKTVFYFLDDDHVHEIFKQGFRHILEK